MTQSTRFDFDNAASRLINSSRGGKISIADFKAIAPEITSQIRADNQSCFLKLWGQSRNIDENARAKIVDPKIMAAIGRIAKTDLGTRSVYHSGLLHTYGYLFSTLETKYGFKRDRWVGAKIENGLRLPKKSLSPFPKSGTLFSNVSTVAARIVYRHTLDPTIKNCLDSSQIDSQLLDYDFNKLKIARIVETAAPKRNRRQLIINTDLVRFPARSTASDSLLVYSIQFHGERPLIYTCFPVSLDARNQLLRDARANQHPVTLRYNAIVGDVSQEEVSGECKIIEG